MLLSLLAAMAAAPVFWLLVPQRHRKDYLAVVSVVALGLYDYRLPLVVLALIALLYVAARSIGRVDRRAAWWIACGGLVFLALFFVYNKLSVAGDGGGALPSQRGLTLIGMSYFVLKAGSILIETSRRTLEAPSFLSLTRWLLYFPIFTSGPIEAFKHFDDQEPTVELDRIMRGLERILLGCVRALVFSHYLAVWTTPILQDPSGSSLPVLLLVMYGLSLRIYFDFAGYSDIAIGLAALYGYEIQENFDNPLTQRNIVALWQRWHMTLTGWLRIYLFTPYTRALMKRGRSWHRGAIFSGQIVTMTACGLWHDITAAFLVWGALHGLALAWVGAPARDLGRRLPAPLVGWWRESKIGYAASAFLTLSVFSAINIFAFTSLAHAARFLAALVDF